MEVFISQIFKISCVSGKEIEKLRKRLAEVGEECITQAPNSFISVVTHLRNLKNKMATNNNSDDLWTMDWTEFTKLAERCFVETKELHALAQFLHNTGNIIYYDDKVSGLDQYVILNPQALVRTKINAVVNT